MNHPDPEQQTTAPDGRPESSQPDWRRDFPIDTVQDNEVSRRDFTTFMVLTSLAFMVGQFWIVVHNRNFAGKNEQPAPKNQLPASARFPSVAPSSFNYPGEDDPCVLLKTGAETFLAYDQKCTHLSCAVVPDVEQGCLHCPCHHGCFDLQTGRAIAGPPRRPLTRITLESRAGVIYATGIELRTV